MRRRTLDSLLTTGGLIVAAVLLVAGGLLTWASNFATDQVHQQLADQAITMPSGKAIDDPAIKPYLAQFAGQEMTTGVQAKAFADHYIKVHMDASSQGRTYEEVSREFMAAAKSTTPDAAKVKELGELRQTLFMGNTLRGMLLNAYAFGTMGSIAMYAAWASFIGALSMIALSLLGFLHLRRVPAEEEVRLGAPHVKVQPATA
jgi:hypothetical protein